MIRRSLGSKTIAPVKPIKIGARFTQEFIEIVNEHITKKGYGKKGRSKWASEAMLQLGQGWEESTPEDLVLDLLAYKPQVGNVNPVPFTLNAAASEHFQSLLARVNSANKELPDAKTRIIYAAISRRLYRDKA